MVDIRDPVDILARTMWAEARGEGVRGMQAVANVVCNRANNPRWWGSNIVTVCMEPWQFSVWNKADPNRTKMIAVTDADPQFVEALALAREATAGRLADITNGADSYYAAGTQEPAWAEGREPCAVIGRHRFYRVELGQPPVVARVLPTKPAARAENYSENYSGPISSDVPSGLKVAENRQSEPISSDALNAAELASLTDQ